MIKAKKLDRCVQQLITQAAKVPCYVSMPVLREEDGGYCLACFASFFSKENVEARKIPRPTAWFTFDIETGKHTGGYRCKNNDFSRADYISLYDVKDVQVSKAFYEEAMDMLDDIRSGIIHKGKLDIIAYDRYMDKLLQNVPLSYWQFYRELSL